MDTIINNKCDCNELTQKEIALVYSDSCECNHCTSVKQIMSSFDGIDDWTTLDD